MESYGMSFGGANNDLRNRKGKNIIHNLSVTLEELYTGSVRKLRVQRNVICVKCDGRGVRKCPYCRGIGIKYFLQPLNHEPWFHQCQTTCSECGGVGEMDNPDDPSDWCRTCKGRKIAVDEKIFEVWVESGMPDKKKIYFTGEGDQEPGITPGDLIIILNEEKHPIFRRDREDLIYRMELELIEALCGFRRAIKTLDNRYLVVTSTDKVINAGDVRFIRNEGMPGYQNVFGGRLVVEFSVNFPPASFFSLKKIKALKSLFTLPKSFFARRFDDVKSILQCQSKSTTNQRDQKSLSPAAKSKSSLNQHEFIEQKSLAAAAKSKSSLNQHEFIEQKSLAAAAKSKSSLNQHEFIEQKSLSTKQAKNKSRKNNKPSENNNKKSVLSVQSKSNTSREYVDKQTLFSTVQSENNNPSEFCEQKSLLPVQCSPVQSKSIFPGFFKPCEPEKVVLVTPEDPQKLLEQINNPDPSGEIECKTQ